MAADERSDEEKLTDDLLNGYCSAVLVKYIGYISLKKSIREVGKHEQQQICNTCIKIVAYYAKCIKDNKLKKDYTDYIDTHNPQIWNQKASLALSLESIIISRKKKRDDKLLKKPLARICIQDVSLTGIGTGSLSNFFCIVSRMRTDTNSKSDRRVIVLSALMASPLSITSAITMAFLLKYQQRDSFHPNNKDRNDAEESAVKDPDKGDPNDDSHSTVSFNEHERIRPTSILNLSANFSNSNDLPTPDEASSVSFRCKPFAFHMLKESKRLTLGDNCSRLDSNNRLKTEITQLEYNLYTSTDERSKNGLEMESPSQENPLISSEYKVDWEWYDEASTKAEKYGALAVLEVQRVLLTPPGDPPSIPIREEGVYYPPDLYPPRKKKTDPLSPSDQLLETITESTEEHPYKLSPKKTSHSTLRYVKKPSQPICGHHYEHLQSYLSGKQFLEKIQEEISIQKEIEECENMRITKEFCRKYQKIGISENVEEHLQDSMQNTNAMTNKNMFVQEFSQAEEMNDEKMLFVLLAHQNSSIKHIRSNSPSGRIQMPVQRFEQITEYLSDMNWYHGIVRREMAESLIIKDGEFLVRQSANFPGQILLTLMDSDNFPQNICLVDTNARIKTSENEFNSIVQLVKYHLTNRIPLVYGDTVLHIRKPVLRPG